MTSNLPSHDIVASIEHWLDAMVIGQNLCPFANAARRRDLVSIVVASSGSAEQCLQQLSDEAHRLADSEEERTTLLVLPDGFENFDDYLDLLALAEALFEDLEFDGILQIASFHPEYQFEGTDRDDVSNWTNRAPYPILHLLREDSVERAVAGHPDPDSIPQRNIDRLEQLGLAGVLKLLERDR